MTTKAKRSEYFKRQQYRKIPVVSADWRALGALSPEYAGGVPRGRFAAWIIADFVEHPHTLHVDSARPRRWEHAQKGKPRPLDVNVTVEDATITQILEARAFERWLADGAPVLKGGAQRIR